MKTTLAEKRETTKRQLKTSFPSKITLVVGLMHIAIGVSAISFQIVLILNEAVDYKIAGGIWGGFFAIVSGFFKLNLSTLFFQYIIEFLINNKKINIPIK